MAEATEHCNFPNQLLMHSSQRREQFRRSSSLAMCSPCASPSARLLLLYPDRMTPIDATASAYDRQRTAVCALCAQAPSSNARSQPGRGATMPRKLALSTMLAEGNLALTLDCIASRVPRVACVPSGARRCLPARTWQSIASLEGRVADSNVEMR